MYSRFFSVLVETRNSDSASDNYDFVWDGSQLQLYGFWVALRFFNGWTEKLASISDTRVLLIARAL